MHRIWSSACVIRRAFPWEHTSSHLPFLSFIALLPSSLAWFCSNNIYLASSCYFWGCLPSLSRSPVKIVPCERRHLEAGVCFSHQFLEHWVWFQIVAQKINKRQRVCLGAWGKAAWSKKYVKKERGMEEKSQRRIKRSQTVRPPSSRCEVTCPL